MQSSHKHAAMLIAATFIAATSLAVILIFAFGKQSSPDCGAFIVAVRRQLVGDSDKEVGVMHRRRLLDMLAANPRLIQCVDGGKPLALHAVESGDVQRMQLLYSHGMDILEVDNAGMNCIHVAAKTPWTPFGMVEWLVNRGVDINKQDSAGKTPLFYSVSDTQMLNLLALGANINYADFSGDTYCHVLARSGDWSKARWISKAVAHGADLSIANDHGLTVIDELKALKGRIERAEWERIERQLRGIIEQL